MKKPVEMQRSYPIDLHGGGVATTFNVWKMLDASLEGDLECVAKLVDSNPALLTCQFDYTSPLHFAIREGHDPLVRYFVENGALDPGYKVHPFLETLVTLAEDRGFDEIAEFVKQSSANPGLTHDLGDTGKVHFERSDPQIRFQDLVDRGDYAGVEAMLKQTPELAHDDLAFWGEGILCMPAKDGDHRMIELLMSYGAAVPELSKWGARYYFKHYETARFLLENGMNPNHMNWREFALLHDVAVTGETEKARLLIDHGADIDAIDDEYSSTPLGYAAHWGKREIVTLLLERGADPNKAEAAWATPLAWARRKGHAEIEADLRQAGAE